MRDEKKEIDNIDYLSCLPPELQQSELLPYCDVPTLLHLAICSKALHRAVTQSVLSWKTKLYALDYDKNELDKLPPMSITAYQRLCFHGSRYRLPCSYGSEKAWELCCLTGDTQLVRWAYQQGWLGPQTTSHSHRYGYAYKNVLHCVALGGSVETMQFAIDTLHISPRSTDSLGMNALHYAACGGSVEAMRFAVKLGIPADSVDTWRRNALHWAAMGGSIKTMEYAVHTLHIPATSVTAGRLMPGKNALHCAARSGSVKAVRYAMEELGISWQSKSDIGNNVLHYAIGSGSEPLIRYLIEELSIPVTNVNNSGETVLHYAENNRHSVALVRLLCQLNETHQLQLDPYRMDKWEHNAFWYANFEQNLEKKRIVLETLQSIADQTRQQKMYQEMHQETESLVLR
ncbi:MAG: hypothetical protein A3F41_05990 [Coxiella sp. RIFCSPHIGHO2_12_FULL_44_14]|nr:MAG: hypothetical protein A3F41_05990 [Coxiella sp. RIFCSPHIGHO2_12_FULL_44_14]